MRGGQKRPLKRGIVALLGGAAIVASVFLAWIESDGVTIGTHVASKEILGSELDLSNVVLGSGVAAVVFGILALAAPRARRIAGLLLVIVGGVAIAVAVMTMTEIQDTYVDLVITEAQVPAAEREAVQASLGALFEGGVGVEPGIGLYTALAGAALTVLAGIMLAVDRGRDRKELPEPTTAPTPMEPEGDRDETAMQPPHVRLQREIGEPTTSLESRDPEPSIEEGVTETDVDETIDAEPDADESPAQSPEPPPERQPRRDVLGDTWSA